MGQCKCRFQMLSFHSVPNSVEFLTLKLKIHIININRVFHNTLLDKDIFQIFFLLLILILLKKKIHKELKKKNQRKNYKVHFSKMNYSVTFSMFPRLCDHHHYIIRKHFYHPPKKKPYIH